MGDDCQAIYGWRGAEVAHIRRFGQDFPAALKAIRLETNYRSTRTILAAANAVAAQDPEALRKTLHVAFPEDSAGAAIALRAVETSEDGAVGGSEEGISGSRGMPQPGRR